MNVKKKNIAAVLAIILGIFGIHKFYLDKFSAGIIRLVLYTLFFVNGFTFGTKVLFWVGLIEGLMLLTMSQEQFDKQYNGSDTSKGKVWGNKKVPEPPKNNPYIKSGNEKYKQFDYPGAIEDYTKGLVLNPYDNVLHFNLACGYSLMEDAEKSIYHLGKAVEYGYRDIENIKSKDDLAFLRVQPSFDTFLNNNFSTPAPLTKTQNEENELPDLLGQIKILNQKREKGELTDDEYFNERKKLLD